MKTQFLSILSLFTLLVLQAQSPLLISKEEVLKKATENNLSLKISDQTIAQAQADFKQTNSIFLPSITASHTGISTTNPLMAFGSKLNQEILTQADFNPSLLNNPKRTQNFATKIEMQQPLLNIDGIFERKAAKQKMEATALQKQRTKEYLVFEVEKAYMQLQLAYKGVEVLEKAMKAANENKNMAENSYQQGFLQRADVLSVEVRVTEVKNQLQVAKSNVLNASNYLSFLMNDETNSIYQPKDSLLLNRLANKNGSSLSESRSDIKAMELATNAYQQLYKASKMSFLPRLNAFGSYELYDNTLFNANAGGYIIGAQLSWDVFKGYQRIGKLQKNKASYEKSALELAQYKAKNQLEINQTQRALKDAEEQLTLTQLALEQSEESLKIRTNRFKEGLEKTSDLLLAETQFAQKQLEYYQTIFQYNTTQAYLSFLTQ